MHAAVNVMLVKDPPPWDSLAEKTKDYARLAGLLEKNTPERGDKNAWDKLAKDFSERAKELDAAAGKKDRPAAKEAFEKLHAACDNCHENHR